MERFDFFFSLHLGEHLNSHTDNISKDRQGTKMAAVFGQRLPIYANVACKNEAYLANQCLQENNALWPNWRLVLVHQAIPKLAKITLKGYIHIYIFDEAGQSLATHRAGVPAILNVLQCQNHG